MATAVNPFLEAVNAAYQDAQDLLLEKHKFYGPKNISDAPGGALNGLRVRLHDKLARLNNMLDNGLDTGVGESLRDTARDITNYGLIMTLVLDGDWPGAGSPPDAADQFDWPVPPDLVDSDGDTWEWQAATSEYALRWSSGYLSSVRAESEHAILEMFPHLDLEEVE